MITVHKLSAGIDGGYSYLTRQVASADQRRAGSALADYYAARGNPPGLWLGKGAEQLGVAGGEVTEAQTRALFGQGLHPDAEAMRAAGAPAGATKLGAAYPTYAELAPYPQRVADAVEAFATDHGRPPSAAERNQIAAKEARRGRRAGRWRVRRYAPATLTGRGGPPTLDRRPVPGSRVVYTGAGRHTRTETCATHPFGSSGTTRLA